MSGRFEADPAGLQQSGNEVGGLPAHARKIGDDFIADQANYRGLNGYSDEFYSETHPRYEANNEMCLSAIRAFENAFVGLESAIFGNRRNIVGTQEGASDLIQQQHSKLDSQGGEKR
ncbi:MULTISPECIES: hypothetical protein [Streptomyces]|uniref:Uncharacterized protein n=1 Tax=Streptomyces sp. NBC_00093 TaxID=2975649 RepID=A0AAU2A521_9ACTN